MAEEGIDTGKRQLLEVYPHMLRQIIPPAKTLAAIRVRALVCYKTPKKNTKKKRKSAHQIKQIHKKRQINPPKNANQKTKNQKQKNPYLPIILASWSNSVAPDQP